MLAVTRMDVSNVVGHSAGQCQGGVPIRKCSHHVNPAAGITVWPFNHAAGADARPVFYSITIILERSPASGWASFHLLPKLQSGKQLVDDLTLGLKSP